jgi:diguanylate cyclase
MSTTPILYLLMGLLFGTTLLAIGIALGFWMGKKSTPAVHGLPERFASEQQSMLAVMRGMAKWTNDFAGDFTRYQSTMEALTRAASDGKSVKTKEEVQKLLDQIVGANQELQSRLDNAELKLEEQTKQLTSYLTEARTDGLTGLANRKAFDQKLDECFGKWQANKQLFSLALIDVDHFKKVNDTYGHPAGDAVLKEMAKRLGELKDEALIVARYGGEEFGVLFASDDKQAAQAMERLRKSIEGKVFEAEGQKIPVTMSCGVARIAAEERIGKLVRRTDEALYSAKMGGRNRVFIHTGALCELFGNPSMVTVNSGSAPTHNSENLVESRKDGSLEAKLRNKLESIIESERNRT